MSCKLPLSPWWHRASRALAPLLLAGATLPALAVEGLVLHSDSVDWPRWNTRLSISEGGLPPADPAERPFRAALLGDYDLGSLGLALPGTQGRFRATGGLFFDLRGSAAGPGARPTLGLGLSGAEGSNTSAPYLGLGYTGWVPKTGLSFSADIGLTTDPTAGGWRLGRALFGNQGADAASRELRLQPRLQLGVQYRY